MNAAGFFSPVGDAIVVAGANLGVVVPQTGEAAFPHRDHHRSPDSGHHSPGIRRERELDERRPRCDVVEIAGQPPLNQDEPTRFHESGITVKHEENAFSPPPRHLMDDLTGYNQLLSIAPGLSSDPSGEHSAVYCASTEASMPPSEDRVQRFKYRSAVIPTRSAAPIVIIVVIILVTALWIVFRPQQEPLDRFVGQLIGMEGVLLLSIGLVLISTLRVVEQWFDGIDHAAIWHRGVAIAGTVLIAVHAGATTSPLATAIGEGLGAVGLIGLIVLVVWAIAPRWRSFVPKPLRGAVVKVSTTRVARRVNARFKGYSSWRSFHRFTGLFVAIGFAHGLVDGTVFGSPVLRWSYVAIGGIGLAFYAYRELLARRFAVTHDYEVESVHPVDATLAEISLKPLGRRFQFRAGQFAQLNLEAADGWHRHPFSIASGPADANVRVTIRSLGDFTSNVSALVRPGMPAVISSPHGNFDYHKGGERQVWIAGGVGVAPILSWLRDAQPGTLPERVDLYYSAEGPPPYSDEMRELAARHDSLHLHLIDTGTEPRLTTERVLAEADCPARELSAFMCGPEGMVKSFQKGLAKAGVRRANIHREYFNLR